MFIVKDKEKALKNPMQKNSNKIKMERKKKHYYLLIETCFYSSFFISWLHFIVFTQKLL